MKLPETKNLVTVAMVFALIVLTFLYPMEFKERFGQVLGAVLGYYFGVGQNDKK